MRATKSIVAGGTVIILLVTVSVFWRWKRPAPTFSNTTAITFTEGRSEPFGKELTITNAEQVRRVLNTIRLVPKQPCQCSHEHKVTFQTLTGRIEVSFCDHCFAVLGDKKDGWYQNVRDYAMPKEFYAEFRRLVSNRTNEVWQVLPDELLLP